MKVVWPQMMWYSYQNSKVIGLKKGWLAHTHTDMIP